MLNNSRVKKADSTAAIVELTTLPTPSTRPIKRAPSAYIVGLVSSEKEKLGHSKDVAQDATIHATMEMTT